MIVRSSADIRISAIARGFSDPGKQGLLAPAGLCGWHDMRMYHLVQPQHDSLGGIDEGLGIAKADCDAAPPSSVDLSLVESIVTLLVTSSAAQRLPIFSIDCSPSGMAPAAYDG